MASGARPAADARIALPQQALTQPGTALFALHRFAGLLHAAGQDVHARREWLAGLARYLRAERIACFEVDPVARSTCNVIAFPDEEPVWTFPPLEAALDVEAPVGEPFVRTSPGARPGELCQLAMVRRPDGVLQVLAAAHADPAAATHVAEAIGTLVWHLECAGPAVSRAAPARGLTAAALVALLPVACGLTDEAGRVLERNPAFSEFMTQAGIQVATGRLRFADAWLQDSWGEALAAVHATAVPQALLLTLAASGAPWRLHLVPLRCAIDAQDGAERDMVLAVAEPVPPNLQRAIESLVAEGERPLTPAETQVLNALLQGHTAKIIANARGASVNTVRSQIATILEKTRHNNQKSLIAAFSASSFGNSTLGGGSLSPPTRR